MSFLSRYKNEKPSRDYTCPWCGYKFSQGVAKATGINGGKRQTVSDQVKCIKCGNHLKTWD